MDIQLNFLNRCLHKPVPVVLIFQKTAQDDAGAMAIAWKVIRNCGRDWHRPLVFSTSLEINVSDMDGNHLPPLPANNGCAYDLVPQFVGRWLLLSSQPAPSDQIIVRNLLARGAVNANLYSNGSLLAVKAGVSPGMEAVFKFKPTIWVGLARQPARQATEGQPFDLAWLAPACKEISLQGMASADLVLSDGDDDAEPFQFALENVVPSHC